MRYWLRFISYFAPEVHWRLTCPDTIEKIAVDFIEKRLPRHDVLRSLDFSKIDDGDPWLAWRRRINSIYGVGTCFQHPRGGVAKQGWNQRLWLNAPNLHPEELVERIFDTIIVFLKESLETVSTR